MRTNRTGSSGICVRRTYDESSRSRTRRTCPGTTGRCILALGLLLLPRLLRLVRRPAAGARPREGDHRKDVAGLSLGLRQDLLDVRLVLRLLRQTVIALLRRGCPLGEGRQATARAGNQPRRKELSRTRRLRCRRGTIGRRRLERGNHRAKGPAIPPEGADIRHPGGS